MFQLSYAEHSPRVTLLQILLKDEYRLRVDGAFGPKTLAALRAFQAAHNEPALGVTSPGTWRKLLNGTRLAVVSSVDAADQGLAAIDGQALRAAGDTPILMQPMCNALGQLVADVRQRSAGNSLAALRLDGHGNLGRWLTISAGDVVDMKRAEYREVEREIFNYVSAANFSRVASVLAQLKPLFAPFGFAEHHGCSLGSRPETLKMLARLANLWNVPVSVGVRTQDFGVVTYFQGPVRTVFPNGMSLKAWSHQFQLARVRNMSMADVD
jgi:Putative peptidoglycan binding domain